MAIPGSLRAESLNLKLARALPDLLPEGATLDVFELHELPLYNADLDDDEKRPDPVDALKRRLTKADGLILLCPEYNYGVSGVLKNAIDWASRPAFRSPMTGLPTGIMGVARGMGGTMRAQEHLKLHLLAMLAPVYPHRGVAVSRGAERFEGARLSHEETRDFVRDYLEGFVRWVADHHD